MTTKSETPVIAPAIPSIMVTTAQDGELMGHSDKCGAAAAAVDLKETGNAMVKKGDFAEATRIYRKALKLEVDAETETALRANLALCALRLGDYGGCIDECKRILDSNPTHQKARFRLAQAHLEMEDTSEAIRVINESLKFSPKDKDTLILLAKCRDAALIEMNQNHNLSLPSNVITELKKIDQANWSAQSLSQAAEHIKRLSAWIIKGNGDRTALIRKGSSGFDVCPLLKNLIWSALSLTSDGNDIEKEESVWTLWLSCWQFLMVIVIDENGKSAKLDRPIESTKELVACRKEVFKEFPFNDVLKVVRQLIRRGVSDGDGDKSSRLNMIRTQLVSQIFSVCHYVGSLHDSALLSLLAEGLGAVESRKVQRSALHSFGFLCDAERRMGKFTAPLCLSQGVLLCLEALVGMIDSECEFETWDEYIGGEKKRDGSELMTTTSDDIGMTFGPHVEFALISVFSLLADKDRDENTRVDWNHLLTNLVSPSLTSESESDWFRGCHILNLLFMADKDVVRAFSTERNLGVICLGLTGRGASYQDWRCRKAAADLLLNLLEFPEVRLVLMNDANAIGILIDWISNHTRDTLNDIEIKAVYLACLARFATHGHDVKELVFDLVDIFAVSGEIMSKMEIDKLPKLLSCTQLTIRQKQAIVKTLKILLQIVFLVTVHGDAKRRLLGLPEAQKSTKIEELHTQGDNTVLEGDASNRRSQTLDKVEDVNAGRTGVLEGETETGERENETVMQGETGERENETVMKEETETGEREIKRQDGETKEGETERQQGEKSSSSNAEKCEETHYEYEECVGSDLLSRDLVNLSRAAVRCEDVECRFLICGALHNLVRSEEDKERLQKTAGGPDFDEDQLMQLQVMFDKLPEHAKPVRNAKYCRGSRNLATLMRSFIARRHGSLISDLSEIVTSGKIKATPHLAKLCATTVTLFCKEQNLRALVYRSGGSKVLKRCVSLLSADEQRDVRQTMAQICMAVDSRNFSYSDALDLAGEMITLLDDHYELFVYEGAMALVNLSAEWEEVRRRLWGDDAKGWLTVREVAISDNDLVRSAGTEIICNMVASDWVKDKLEQSLIEKSHLVFDLRFLMAVILEFETLRTVEAALGALAVLSSQVSLGLAIARLDKFENVFTCLDHGIQTKNSGIEMRCIALLQNIWNVLVFLNTHKEGDSQWKSRQVTLDPSRFITQVESNEYKHVRKSIFVSLTMLVGSKLSAVSEHEILQNFAVDDYLTQIQIPEGRNLPLLGPSIAFWEKLVAAAR